MIKNKNDLFDEINNVKCLGNDIYVGELEEINCDTFDTNNLCVGTLFNYSICLNSYKTKWNETNYSYVFEKIKVEDRFMYREIFSGIKFKLFDFESLLKLHGIYISSAMPYNDYISLTTDDCKKKVKVLNN